MEWISESVFYICVTAVVITFFRCLNIKFVRGGSDDE